MAIIDEGELQLRRNWKQFPEVLAKFEDHHGIYTKCLNSEGKLFGYLLRCEVPVANADPNVKYVSFRFQISEPRVASYDKSIGMNACMIAPLRLIKQMKEKNYISDLSTFVGYPFNAVFPMPNTNNTLFAKASYKESDINIEYCLNDYWQNTDVIFNYNEFYQYLVAFEKRARDYYKDKKIIPIWSCSSDIYYTFEN